MPAKAMPQRLRAEELAARPGQREPLTAPGLPTRLGELVGPVLGLVIDRGGLVQPERAGRPRRQLQRTRRGRAAPRSDPA